MIKYNDLVVNRLKEKYGVSKQFIRASLRGARVSETSSKIIEDYAVISEKIDKALKGN